MLLPEFLYYSLFFFLNIKACQELEEHFKQYFASFSCKTAPGCVSIRALSSPSANGAEEQRHRALGRLGAMFKGIL